MARRKVAVRFTRRARSHLLAIRTYLSERSPAASTRVLAQIQRTARLLSDFPELGRRTADPEIFELVVPRYLYVVAYRIDADRRTISILGVFHAAQGSREV